MSNQSAVDFPGNFRIHVALAVTDLQRARQFYELLLGVQPAKERPGYIKFEPQDPSVNLTLNETNPDQLGSNPATHFGVQVKSTEAVQEAVRRFTEAGLETAVEENTTCCYAVQDKVWATDPDGNKWEVFVVLEADADQYKDSGSDCCETALEQASSKACC